MVALVAAAAAAVSGCHVGAMMMVAQGSSDRGPYRAEAIAGTLGAASVRTLGCLDVGLAVHERNGSELLDVHIGNRCIHPEALDLAGLTVRGLGEGGGARAVMLSDPRSEITPMHVGGAEGGVERLRLEGAHGLDLLCFDVGHIAPDAPQARPAALCFERTPAGWRPTPRAIS